MTAIRTTLYLALTALTLSCGGSSPSTAAPQPSSNKVDVTIAAVTLADDCGTPAVAAPERGLVHKDSAEAEADSSRPTCRQSSVQLRIANNTAAPSRIVIRKVELLDESGALISALTPREPSRWAADVYQGWDEHVAPGDTIQASYALSDPAAIPARSTSSGSRSTRAMASARSRSAASSRSRRRCRRWSRPDFGLELAVDAFAAAG